LSVNDVVVEDQDGRFAFLHHSDNDITQQIFWVYSGDEYRAAATLDVAASGWIKKLTPGQGPIYFRAVAAAVADRNTTGRPVPDSVERPPAPPRAFGDNEVSGGGGSGGGSGCFISTIID